MALKGTGPISQLLFDDPPQHNFPYGDTNTIGEMKPRSRIAIWWDANGPYAVFGILLIVVPAAIVAIVECGVTR